jgi:hypothetical protein
MKSVFQAVIFTVPHSYACSKTTRTCDKRAFRLGNELFSVAQKNNIPSTLLVADVERSRCDLNREIANQPGCSESKFWRTLKILYRNLVQESAGNSNRVFIVDCHSFPSGTAWNSKTDLLYDAVILLYGEDAMNEPWNVDLITRLKQHSSLIVDLISASNVNAIILSFGPKKSILFEINESISAEKATLINSVFDEWMKIWFQKSSSSS